jgi:hypothetical protein
MTDPGGRRGVRSSVNNLAPRLMTDQVDFLVVALTMGGGIAAFLWAGFAGDPHSPNLWFSDPWTLFLWFCVLIILAELYAGRRLSPSGRMLHLRGKGALLSLTLVCVLAIVAVRLYVKLGGHFPGIQRLLDFISSLFNWIHLTSRLGFNLLNIGIIVAAVLVLAWARRNSTVVIWPANNRPVPGERTAGDFLILGFISLAEAPFFLLPVMQSITGNSSIDPCDLTLLRFPCSAGSTPALVTTLFVWDLALALFCALLALVIITSSALLEALKQGSHVGYIAAFLRIFWAAVVRRFNPTILFLSLRPFWPVLILLATIGAVVTSSSIQQLLVNLAERAHGNLLWPDQDPQNYLLRLKAVGGAAVMLVATLVAVALQKVPRGQHSFARLRVTVRRVALIAGRRVWTIGYLIALSYWSFSLIFSGINALVLYAGQWLHQNHQNQGPAVFVQPDPLAILSLALFTLFLYRYLRRTGREALRPRRRAPASVGARASSGGTAPDRALDGM